MNDKGQTLVVFILLLPIIFILIAIIVDLGYLELSKQKTENEIKSTITYGLKNIKKQNIKQKMEKMLEENTEGIKTVEVNDETIKVSIKYNQENIFNNIIENNHEITITYNGYIENNKLIIAKG